MKSVRKQETLNVVQGKLIAASDVIASIGGLNADALTMFEAYEIVKSTVSVQRTLQSRLEYIEALKNAEANGN